LELLPKGFASMSTKKMNDPVEREDFYWEDEFIVFTREFLMKRGQCCGSGCRHCPYEPQWTKGAIVIATENNDHHPH
jgi:hypothetical protein